MINSANKDNLFNRIPPDCLCEIAGFSDLETTLNLRVINKTAYKAIETHNSSMVWREKEKQYGYFKEGKENPKANAVIGFKITNIKNLSYSDEKEISDKEKIRKTLEVIKLLDYFELNNFIERTKMIVMDIFNNDSTQIQDDVFVKIAEAYIKIGNLEKALKIAENIANDYSKSRVLKLIAKAYIKIGNLEKALKIAENIANDYSKSRVLKLIAEAYIKIGNLEKTEKILGKAEEIAKNITDDYYKFGLLALIAEAYIKIGNLEKALEIAENIVGNSKSEVLELIAAEAVEAYIIKTKNLEKAEKVLGKTLEIAKNSVFQFYINLYDLYRAFDDYFCFFTSIAKKYKILKDELVLVNTGEYNKSNVLKSIFLNLLSIAEAYIKIGKLKEALKITENIPDNDCKDSILASISEVCVSRGIRKSEDILEIAENITDDYYKFKVFALIAEKYIKISITEKYIKTVSLEEVLKIVENIPDYDYKSRVLKSIAEAYIEKGELEKALKIAENITDDYLKSRVLGLIAEKHRLKMLKIIIPTILAMGFISLLAIFISVYLKSPLRKRFLKLLMK